MAASEPVAKQEELPVWHAFQWRMLYSLALGTAESCFQRLPVCTFAKMLMYGPLRLPGLPTGNRRQAAPHTVRRPEGAHEHQGHPGGR